MPVVYLNGDWLDRAEARISIDDRGFLLGDGVFETGRLHHGAYFRLEHHLRRLGESAEYLRLAVPSIQQMADIAQEIAARNPFKEASLRITVTRGSGGRGLSRRGAGPNTVLVTLAPMADDWLERSARGWTVRTASVRRPSVASVPAQLKGLGRSYALLAHYEAEDAGFDDALLLSSDGFVAEGPTWNVFWRVGGTIFTPALSAGILEGVTRSLIIELASAAGYTIEEGVWGRDRLDRADELFATMTSNGVVPITRLDGRGIPSTDAAERLQVLYWQRVRAEVGQKGIDRA
jgi:branched-chain amino acid aminotransferase